MHEFFEFRTLFYHGNKVYNAASTQEVFMFVYVPSAIVDAIMNKARLLQNSQNQLNSKVPEKRLSA